MHDRIDYHNTRKVELLADLAEDVLHLVSLEQRAYSADLYHRLDVARRLLADGYEADTTDLSWLDWQVSE